VSNKLQALIERKEKLGGNIGALDFLINLHRMKNMGGENLVLEPLKFPTDEISQKTNVSDKYKRIFNISSEISSRKMSDEFDFLLEYAAEIRKIEMSETYLKLIKYLLVQYKFVSDKNKRALLFHLSNALRLSKDDELVEFVYDQNLSLILELQLSPKQIDELFFTNLSNSYDYSSNDCKYLAFDLHTEAHKALSIILNNNPEKILNANPEYYCLFCNASSGKNLPVYKSSLNNFLVSHGLPVIKTVSFGEKNILSTVNFSETPVLKEGPLVSIIMSAFNAEDTIVYAINSLLLQSYQNIEILVCDDMSSDSTFELIKNLEKKDHRVKAYQSKNNQGTYNIRNEMIQKAKGKYITFQDSDDYALPIRIELQVSELTRTGKAMCVGQWVRITPNGEFVYFYDDKLSRFCVVSSMVQKDIFYRCGNFRESLVAADTEFYEKMTALFGETQIHRIEKPLILGLWGEGSLTKAANLSAENNGFVAQRRRKYSDIAARQRILGKDVISDQDIVNVLKANNIHRPYSGTIKA
jgi:hypothetical protein